MSNQWRTVSQKVFKSMASLAISGGLIVSAAHAATNTWITGNGDFNTAANWDTGTAPANGDDTVFTNSTSYTVSFSSAPATIDNSTFDGQAGALTLNLSAQTWTITNSARVAQHSSTTSSVVQTSGSLTVFSDNGGTTNTGLLVVGDSGVGSYALSNGTMTVLTTWIGNSASGVGSLTFSGSSSFLNPGVPFAFGSTAGNIVVGRVAGTSGNSLIVSNSASITTGDTTIGGNIAASNNTAQVVAGAFWELAQRPLSMGGYASRLVVNNATINDAGTFLVGTSGGILDTAILTNNAQMLTGFGNLRIGNGDGTYSNVLIVAGNSVLNCGDGGAKGILLGASGFSSNNTVLITGGGMITNAASITIGDTSAGKGGNYNGVVLNDAGKLFTGSINCGNGVNSTGNYFQVGGAGAPALANTGTITLGIGTNSAYNLMIITNATLLSGSFRLGNAPTSASNTCSVLGGAVWNLGGLDLQIGRSGASTNLMTIDGGSVTNVRGVTVGVSGAVNNTLYVLHGALLDCGSLTVGSTTNDNLNTLSIDSGGSVVCTGLVTVGGASGFSLSNALVLTGGQIVMNSLRVRTTNTLTFAAGTLNTGGTTVDDGANTGAPVVVGDGASAASLELAAGGTGFHNFNDGLVITNNATLRGVGTVMGNLTVLGTLAPGFSIGTIVASNNVVLGSFSTLAFELGSPGSSDLLECHGNLTLDGTVNLSDAGGFGIGDYTLITYTGTLTDNGLLVGTKPNPSLTYTIDTGTAGSVVLHVTSGPSDPFTAWQTHYFPGGGPNAAGTADPDHDGLSNTNEFLTGFNPTNGAAYLHIVSIAKTNNDIRITYLGANGDSTWSPGIASRTNVLEFTTGTANGSYATNNFVTTGQTNILSGGTGSGLVTNMVDAGGATNTPSRFYRIRVLAP